MLNSRNFRTGIRLVGNTTLTGSVLGDLQSYTVDGQLYYNDGTGNKQVLTGSGSSVVTNKQLDDSTVYFIDHSDPTLQFHFDAAGTTGTKTTLTSSQTVNRVITLPDATDTLVGRATTDTLTNKSIDGGSNTITNISLTSSVTGILPIANGGTNASSKSAAFDSLSPMTTGGDIIYGGVSGTGTRLPNGSAGQVLTSNGTTLAPIWATPSPGFVNPMTSVGDLIVGGSSGTATRLGIGSTGQVLTVSGGTAVWAPVGGGTVTAVTASSPLASSGGATPNISLTGIVPVANGGTGSATQNFVDLTTAQSISGAKTFNNAITLTEISTPATPSITHNSLYFKSDGFLYMLDSNGVETLVSPGISGTGYASYTPIFTGFGTPTGVNFQWRRVGDSIQILGTFTSGTNTATTASFSLPTSLTTVSAIATNQIIGTFASSLSNVQANTSLLSSPTSTTVNFGFSNITGGDLTPINGSVYASNTVFSIECSVPITGWTVNNGGNGSVVSSLNSLTGALNITAGSGITVTPSGSNIQIAATGGGGSGLDFFASSQITSNSSAITGTTFSTFSNDPGFNFTPNFTGTYKVYSLATLEGTVGTQNSFARITNTVGGASLLNEQAAAMFDPVGANQITTIPLQSIFSLTASTSYTFAIQGKVSSAGSCNLNGSFNPMYIFAERIG